MSEFFEFKEIGKLQIERELFSLTYPILFTCRSNRGKLYLCVCCQSNATGQKWMIAETTPGVIIDLLTDKITIRDSFFKYHGEKYTIEQKKIDDVTIYYNEDDWNIETSVLLPDKGEFIEAEDDEFENEIAFYKIIKVRDNNKVLKSVIRQLSYRDQILNKIVRRDQYVQYYTHYNKRVCVKSKNIKFYNNDNSNFAA